MERKLATPQVPKIDSFIQRLSQYTGHWVSRLLLFSLNTAALSCGFRPHEFAICFFVRFSSSHLHLTIPFFCLIFSVPKSRIVYSKQNAYRPSFVPH